jgi:ribosomal 30S subunit maturation factor RimM
MTSALFQLRCVQLGLSIFELEEYDLGFVLDMFQERANDAVEYDEWIEPDQSFFDNF